MDIDETGQRLFEDYVAERINGDVSIWAPVKRENKMFMFSEKENDSQDSRQGYI